MPQNNFSKNQPAKILVIRFSAMGDVILTKPVLQAFIDQYPQIEISLISREFFRPLFQDIPGLTFISADLKGKHKGLTGLWRLAQELKELDFNMIIDIHSVLRSFILSFFINLPLMNLRIFRIHKGRREKQSLTRRYNKVRRPLKHTLERYVEVFTKAGFPLNVNTQINSKKVVTKKMKPCKIGIAPLSRHPLKEWPVEYMKTLMQYLIADFKCQLYILGGADEKDRLMEYSIPESVMMAGKLSFSEEIEFIKTLDLVITMDSANMHLAGVLGIPNISFWGPTHPGVGFAPVGDVNLIIQNQTLNCRPCSVFGNKPCFRKDHACMQALIPELVYKEVKAFISKLFV